ncbi:MAG TPA: choline ABC transporter ATP-binding protein [Thiolinea sp.]|nr:choline ABC transporter ATP-binding protein [Thiolinea sp.]
MAVVEFRNVDILFGSRPGPALKLLDLGASRQDILQQTGQVVGVADASLSIETGEICVLMGLSGSGKSTLLRAVNGLNPVTRGQVLVEYRDKPVDVARCNAGTLRQLRMNRVAMVFQQFGLLPWRTVRENVGLGLELRGMARRQRDTIVDQQLERVGLSQWAGKYAHELSGGMQQRVGLARAFATDADILLMDEPFSALDPLIRTRLQDELLALQEGLKKTIIFVSHDLDEAMKLGNRIAIMEAGHIVQYGQPEAIVLNPVNDYVSDFVAHMNPIHVLSAAALMSPLTDLRQHRDEYLLDEQGRLRMQLDQDGGILSVVVNGIPVDSLQPAGSSVTDESLSRSRILHYARPDTLMKALMELNYQTGLPVPVIEGGRLLGVVGNREIYRGVLRIREP